MNIDPDLSRFQFTDEALEEFDAEELTKLRYVLRRLRYLEYQISLSEDTSDSSGVHTLMEMNCLAWLLKEVGFLPEQDRVPPAQARAVSGNVA